jgi:hypothetical protein
LLGLVANNLLGEPLWLQPANRHASANGKMFEVPAWTKGAKKNRPGPWTVDYLWQTGGPVPEKGELAPFRPSGGIPVN